MNVFLWSHEFKEVLYVYIYITYTCVREDQTLSWWIWNYSHFLNFLAAQEKENRPPTALPLRWMFLLSFVCEFTKPQQLRTSKLLWSFSVTATYPGTKTAVLHNKEQSWNEAAAVRWLSTSGRLLAAAASISQQGKIMLSCCPDKMTEAALITFPQGSVKFQLTSYLNLICTDVDRMRDKQVQTVFSHRLIEAEGLEEVQTKSSFTTTFSTETEQFRQTLTTPLFQNQRLCLWETCNSG